MQLTITGSSPSLWIEQGWNFKLLVASTAKRNRQRQRDIERDRGKEGEVERGIQKEG